MAQGRNNNGNSPYLPLAGLTPEIWAEACATAGYAMDDSGNAVIGVSGDSGDGYLVSVGSPVSIDMSNLVRALLSHALRVGQQGVKQSKSPTRQVASDSANSAINGAYKPARDRSVNVVEREAERLFEQHVATLVRAAKPEATEDDIAATLKKQADSDGGKAWIAAKKKEVLASGTYSVSRKGKGTGAEIAITL